VAYSPDGRVLASASKDGTVRLWGMSSHQLLATLTGHESIVTSVAFSPDGRVLASGSGDKTVRLWDVASRQLLATLTGHENRVFGVAWSPDGRFLASGSADKTVHLWDLRLLSDRRPWPERIAEAERQYQLHLEGLDLKPIHP
jgi:WD40 repeat protein